MEKAKAYYYHHIDIVTKLNNSKFYTEPYFLEEVVIKELKLVDIYANSVIE